MTPIKRRVNATYHWMEGNVVTAILVSSGLSAGLAVVLVGALGLYSSATFQAKTACSKDPTSKACAEIREEVARAEPLTNPCISHQRVEGTKGRNCPRFFVPRPGQRHANVRAAPGLEGVAEGGLPAAEAAPISDAGGLAPNATRGKPDRDTPSKQPPASDRDDQSPADPTATSPTDTGPSASSDPPGNGNGPPEGMPEQASGPFGNITGNVGGAVHEVGQGLDKATCPALDRLAGLCSVLSP